MQKNLVLDGQQRLQSLYIGLNGSFDGRELHFDILSGEIAAPDDIKYKFKFLYSENATFPWVKFKKLVFSNDKARQIGEELTKAAGRNLTTTEQDKINDHIELVLLCHKCVRRVMRWQHGQRGKARAMARAIAILTDVIEFGT